MSRIRLELVYETLLITSISISIINKLRREGNMKKYNIPAQPYGQPRARVLTYVQSDLAADNTQGDTGTQLLFRTAVGTYQSMTDC